MSKKIAVVIVNYNGIEDTLACIQSVLRSIIPVKIIVVDNASREDESKKIFQIFKDVKVFRNNENMGFAGGNNVGIKWALDNDFEYIALLNNDTIIDQNLFKKLLSSADENTISAPYMYYFSYPDELWYGGGSINLITAKATHKIKKNESLKPFKNTFVTGCCFLAHRKIWERVGLLDESYFMYLEDVDFCIRILQKGYKIIVNPSAVLWHKVGKSSGNNSAFLIYYLTRNRILLHKKQKNFFSPFSVVFVYTSVCARILKNVVKKNGLWKYAVRGFLDAHKGLTGATYKKI